MNIARIANSESKQTIELPSGFRMAGKWVAIRRRGEAVVLEPLADDWQWLDELAGKIDPEVFESMTQPGASVERSESAGCPEHRFN